MDIQILIVSLLCSLFAVSLAVLFFALWHRARVRRLKHKPEEEWLFYRWSDTLYDLLTKSDPVKFGRKIGMNTTTYLRSCNIAGIKPDLKNVIAKKLLGFIIIAVSGLVGVLFGNVIIIAAGIFLSIPLLFFEVQAADKAAKRKQFRMTEELPRFIDLLNTALLINMPVEDAILTTAKNLPDMMLAKELLKAVSETRLGIYDWQTALERMSRRVEIDVLSDFSLDLITSYSKGVPIADAVMRKSRDIKQSNLLSMKERATKLTSTILLPVLAFKVLPLLALLCIPIIRQITEGL